jgi:perosamine synthetase
MSKHQVTVGNVELNAKAKKYLKQIANSSRLTYGPFTRKLESKFANIHQAKWAVFTSSGTGALHAGLATLKEVNHWQDGDEVLVPAISFVTTANIVHHLHLKPIFIDVEPDTFNIDPKKIEEKITSKTKAIIPVHILGLPANMIEICKLAKKHNLQILEDSCDTMFVGINHKSVGSFGNLTAFSTYVAHLLPTGLGGFLIGNSPKLEKIVRSYIFHGRHVDYLSIDDDHKKNQKNLLKNRFRFDRIGYHYRPTEMEAAIGLSMLEDNQYQIDLRKRQRLAKELIELLSPLEDKIQLPFTPKGFQHAYMMFTILIKDKKINKWKFIEFLESNGIATRELLPLLNQPAYIKTFGRLESQFPVAKMINQKGFYIGCHPYMNSNDIKYISQKFHEFLSK